MFREERILLFQVVVNGAVQGSGSAVSGPSCSVSVRNCPRKICRVALEIPDIFCSWKKVICARPLSWQRILGIFPVRNAAFPPGGMFETRNGCGGRMILIRNLSKWLRNLSFQPIFPSYPQVFVRLGDDEGCLFLSQISPRQFTSARRNMQYLINYRERDSFN